MRQTFKHIKQSVTAAHVTTYNDTVKVLFPDNLLFSFNSKTIDTNAFPLVKKFSDVLNKYDKTAVLISGYTDSIGTDDYNNDLSAQRADTAKKVLMKYDVKADRINTWGMGKRHPVATNQTEEGRALNRRVEFIILYKEVNK